MILLESLRSPFRRQIVAWRSSVQTAARILMRWSDQSGLGIAFALPSLLVLLAGVSSCAHQPRLSASSGSVACDKALRTWKPPALKEGESGDSSGLSIACRTNAIVADHYGTDVADLSRIEEFRTASSPNGHCEYDLLPRRAGEAPTLYYDRAILPYQAVRKHLIRETAHDEVDLDCVASVYAPDELTFHARTGKFDPVAAYWLGMRMMKSGCAPAEDAFPILLQAGRAMPSKEAFDSGMFKPGETRIPEALYAAAAVAHVCKKDDALYRQLRAESFEAGHSPAKIKKFKIFSDIPNMF